MVKMMRRFMCVETRTDSNNKEFIAGEIYELEDQCSCDWGLEITRYLHEGQLVDYEKFDLHPSRTGLQY